MAKKLTPEQIEQKIVDLGYDIISVTQSMIKFWYRGQKVQYFPKSEWFSGKSVKDSRGIEELFKQITPEPVTKNSYLRIVSTVVFDPLAGSNLQTVIPDIIAFCKLYKCNAELKFNGCQNVITPSTDAQIAIKEWFNG